MPDMRLFRRGNKYSLTSEIQASIVSGSYRKGSVAQCRTCCIFAGARV